MSIDEEQARQEALGVLEIAYVSCLFDRCELSHALRKGDRKHSEQEQERTLR